MAGSRKNLSRKRKHRDSLELAKGPPNSSDPVLDSPEPSSQPSMGTVPTLPAMKCLPYGEYGIAVQHKESNLRSQRPPKPVGPVLDSPEPSSQPSMGTVPKLPGMKSLLYRYSVQPKESNLRFQRPPKPVGPVLDSSESSSQPPMSTAPTLPGIKSLLYGDSVQPKESNLRSQQPPKPLGFGFDSSESSYQSRLGIAPPVQQPPESDGPQTSDAIPPDEPFFSTDEKFKDRMETLSSAYAGPKVAELKLSGPDMVGYRLAAATRLARTFLKHFYPKNQGYSIRETKFENAWDTIVEGEAPAWNRVVLTSFNGGLELVKPLMYYSFSRNHVSGFLVERLGRFHTAMAIFAHDLVRPAIWEYNAVIKVADIMSAELKLNTKVEFANAFFLIKDILYVCTYKRPGDSSEKKWFLHPHPRAGRLKLDVGTPGWIERSNGFEQYMKAVIQMDVYHLLAIGRGHTLDPASPDDEDTSDEEEMDHGAITPDGPQADRV
ncbi:uncharacterized protein BDZ99DRAFT_569925 [Mytilinidion resinicola]|uniref:Uncharacterized protein n=1 Tax=Mytilinidion resinicola TaxID=574789 RepID=A0A6A6YUC9_9PEZI|nr:uncharacterized protein BDZ99DRAFT_569925 [Mytilinidion resinicola]KAF2811993.1 hypothetical protein BDZ99DRAFT_569925 [Mytilinidion resinicola]